ncbi:SecDF P1 head subdomain-containing protein [Veronia pacifica]|uniref:SecDF P1 head subdomain domain-containing protein n=1 Tax=Veronia pacifica TaxID=1080227 RepID=A0A1C3EBJ1_9GAMM|nr:hypothetical protein [Veronia pacifica]ODA30611.1 hypothetical protein A8L45_19970 [Veronia pacifica]
MKYIVFFALVVSIVACTSSPQPQLALYLADSQLTMPEGNKPEIALIQHHLRGQAVVTEKDIIATTRVDAEPTSVNMTLSKAAAERLWKISSANIGEKMALSANGQLMNVAVIQSPIGGMIRLTGLPEKTVDAFLAAGAE